MNEKPEALRLADGLERGIQLYLESLKNGDQQMTRLSSVAAELRRLHAENEALTATRDRQAAMLRRLEEREAELVAEIGRLRDDLRQSSIDITRAEVERLRELLIDARGAKWLVVQNNLLDRIDPALRREEP